jgi:hypothetical protein
MMSVSDDNILYILYTPLIPNINSSEWKNSTIWFCNEVTNTVGM